MKNKAEFYAKLANLMVEHELKMIYPNTDEAIEAESTDGSFIELGSVLTPDSLRNNGFIDAAIDEMAKIFPLAFPSKNPTEEQEKDAKKYCSTVHNVSERSKANKEKLEEIAELMRGSGIDADSGSHKEAKPLPSDAQNYIAVAKKVNQGLYDNYVHGKKTVNFSAHKRFEGIDVDPDAHKKTMPDPFIRIPPISKADEERLKAIGANTGEWHAVGSESPFVAVIDNTKFYVADPKTASTVCGGSKMVAPQISNIDMAFGKAAESMIKGGNDE